jgi:mannose-6-phosphate isomerase-like protein (cupin superfamily)
MSSINDISKVNLKEKFLLFSDYWNPRIAGSLNGQEVKLAKFQGPFIWHSHPDQDELFLVVKGSFSMELRDGSIQLDEGEFLIIPRGMEHRPVAENEVWVLLFEPAGTINTGDVINERTKTELQKI